jgi:restriction system protein
MDWKVQVPPYDALTLPLLQFAADGVTHQIREAVEAIAGELGITDDQRDEMLPSGKKRRFDDRLQWACTYLKKACLLESVGWGKFRITERGRQALRQNPIHINRHYLMQFPEFVNFIRPNIKEPLGANPTDDIFFDMDMTPQDLIQAAHLGLQQDLADDLLDIVLSSSPAFFERLVIDLLLAMGYGGSREDAGRAMGRTGDGGIDGYIQEDKLGLDIIYVQAKRWARNKTVGRPEIQAFVGSLMGAGAKKGVFMTTSRFSQTAIKYAGSIQHLKVILIDGAQLTQLMIEHDVGVTIERTYTAKMIDRDYFDID